MNSRLQILPSAVLSFSYIKSLTAPSDMCFYFKVRSAQSYGSARDKKAQKQLSLPIKQAKTTK